MSTKKVKKNAFREEIAIPENVELEISGSLIKVNGPQGSNERKLANPKITIIKENNKVVLSSTDYKKNEKRILNTFKAHIKNLIDGAVHSYNYTLKICSGHFPMNVSLSNNKVIIKNFLAEKIPREARILPNVDVKINGDIITVKSIDKELAGQTAANIEQACRIVRKDRRVFMDGIFITSKADKQIK
ncbi:MAG: 50S ribosomal protein L6 [Nanoarchaeota archaeon]